MAGVAIRDSLKVVLVLGLRLRERASRCELSDHTSRPQARSLDIGDRLFGDALLLVARIENGRSVAESKVVALTIARRRIVNLEEEVDQRAVADPVRIKNDLDPFRMGSATTIGRG